jgi:ketosteroid isomerase-like protein
MNASILARGTGSVFAIAALLVCSAVQIGERAHAAEPDPAAESMDLGGPEELRNEVLAAERAFAKTMADRDHAAFTRMLAKETVFFSGPKGIRGAEAVAAAWKKFFEGEKAPFSWEPDTVHVLDSGTLAMTSGPVHDPNGRLIGRFSSVWRRDAPGTWRIVFDKGCEVCQQCAQ